MSVRHRAPWPDSGALLASEARPFATVHEVGNNGETPLTRAAVGRPSGWPGGARRPPWPSYSRSTRSPLLTRAATSPAKRRAHQIPGGGQRGQGARRGGPNRRGPAGHSRRVRRERVEEAVDRLRGDLEVELHAPRHVADAEGLVGVVRSLLTRSRPPGGTSKRVAVPVQHGERRGEAGQERGRPRSRGPAGPEPIRSPGPWALRQPPHHRRRRPAAGRPGRRPGSGCRSAGRRPGGRSRRPGSGTPSLEVADIGPPITTTPSSPDVSVRDVVAGEDAAGVDVHPGGEQGLVDGERRFGGHVLDDQAVRHG